VTCRCSFMLSFILEAKVSSHHLSIDANSGSVVNCRESFKNLLRQLTKSKIDEEGFDMISQERAT
jgi:hypothetical protein